MRRQPDRRCCRVAVSSRGDALTPYLTAALAGRYGAVPEVSAELTPAQRALVALATFRPSRRSWVERFFKSELAFHLRSGNADRRWRQLDVDVAVRVQVHALFRQTRGTHVIYVDCTHRQSARSWPAWNPLHGAGLERWYAREQGQYLAADHLFAFSSDTATSLVDDYAVPRDRVTVVGAGVNFRAAPPVRSQAEPGAPVVLFVGNDFVRKGGEVLLRAFERVRLVVPDARLRIVGTRYEIPAQPGVEVLGRVGDRARMAALYAEAQVFALPSLYDPFPLVLLEAMANGLACVSTTTSGVPEIVLDGRTGLLTTPGSEQELAAALVDLLTDPERTARLGEAGRQRAERHFTWAEVVARMAPVLDRLAPAGPDTTGLRTGLQDPGLAGD